ncbi:hypothetical protein CEXT_710071 [Caerostris extrusa]|uniref:Uncharacterized protein n=1 Tax=Caerostris extrusa TaxID=172846 RepID=A0AAV4VUS0_CAEEX|nr:hypothetical protein CEXT_710071 [Caerostris extrusa]
MWCVVFHFLRPKTFLENSNYNYNRICGLRVTTSLTSKTFVEGPDRRNSINPASLNCCRKLFLKDGISVLRCQKFLLTVVIYLKSSIAFLETMPRDVPSITNLRSLLGRCYKTLPLRRHYKPLLSLACLHLL